MLLVHTHSVHSYILHASVILVLWFAFSIHGSCLAIIDLCIQFNPHAEQIVFKIYTHVWTVRFCRFFSIQIRNFPTKHAYNTLCDAFRRSLGYDLIFVWISLNSSGFDCIEIPLSSLFRLFAWSAKFKACKTPNAPFLIHTIFSKSDDRMHWHVFICVVFIVFELFFG